jgi:hypothetical protein
MEAKVLDVFNTSRSRVECELFENRPVRLIGAQGLKVYCLSGTAWITAVGAAHDVPADDVSLLPGQVWIVPNNGLVLAEAIGEAKIRVETPRAARPFTLRPGLEFVAGLVRGVVHLRRRFAA